MCTAPNELVFCSSNALRDIYLRRGKAEGGVLFLKKPTAYPQPPGGVHSILTVRDDADRWGYRRLFSHAFSDKALQEQAPLLEKYVDLLMRRLREADGPQNMIYWYNFVAFDIIGDLTLGESFDCLQGERIHPPTPRGGPRVVPGKGEVIDVVWVPRGVSKCSCSLVDYGAMEREE